MINKELRYAPNDEEDNFVEWEILMLRHFVWQARVAFGK
jgi:hypothetical protein